MSKYIRTENGVYDTSKGIYIPSIKMYAIGTETIYEKDIINKADTIEELVDEYVVIRDNTKINQLVRTDDTNYLKELIKEDKRIIEIKGAIWTDKGLIYVANMNEEGELYYE